MRPNDWCGPFCSPSYGACLLHASLRRLPPAASTPATARCRMPTTSTSSPTTTASTAPPAPPFTCARLQPRLIQRTGRRINGGRAASRSLVRRRGRACVAEGEEPKACTRRKPPSASTSSTTTCTYSASSSSAGTTASRSVLLPPISCVPALLVLLGSWDWEANHIMPLFEEVLIRPASEGSVRWQTACGFGVLLAAETWRAATPGLLCCHRQQPQQRL